MKTMTTKDHARWAFAVLSRFVDVFVVWPAIAIFIAFCTTAVTGGNPLRDIISSAYEWADDAVRDAPVGNVMIQYRAVAKLPESEALQRAILATPRQFKAVPMQQAISDSTESLTQIYWTFVVICAGFMLVILGPLRFVCHPRQNALAP